jgi:YHS domain-containing protein
LGPPLDTHRSADRAPDGWLETNKEVPVTDSEQLVLDPVCQMRIRPSDAVATIEHDGKTYYFCSQDCADSFGEAPEDYI